MPQLNKFLDKFRGYLSILAGLLVTYIVIFLTAPQSSWTVLWNRLLGGVYYFVMALFIIIYAFYAIFAGKIMVIGEIYKEHWPTFYWILIIVLLSVGVLVMNYIFL